MNKPFKKDWANYLLLFVVYVAVFVLMCAIFDNPFNWRRTIISSLIGGVVFVAIEKLIPNKKDKNNG